MSNKNGIWGTNKIISGMKSTELLEILVLMAAGQVLIFDK